MKLRHLETTQQEMTGFTKKKQRVNIAYPSQNLNKTPLERNSQKLSFKGVFDMHKMTKALNLNTARKVIAENIGSAEKNHLDQLLKDDWIKQKVVSTIGKDGQEYITFLEETPLNLVLKGLQYPFLKMPANLIEWGVSGLQKIKPLKNNSLLNGILNSKYIQNANRSINRQERMNELRGLVEAANKYFKDDAETQALAMFNHSAKGYSPKTGNYNSVHERSLNRIVSGYIPAFFLANDAYNLSSLCDNDPKVAKKEKNLRFSQEIKRVTLNAYIQLITLGALSKYINKSKTWIIGTMGITVLFTEMFSRLSTGKHISFITPEKAKEENARKSAKTDKTNQKSNADIKPSFKNAAPFALHSESSETFKNFNKSLGWTNSSIKPALAPQDKDRELKPLLSPDTLLKASLAIITAGFALKNIQKIKVVSKNPDVKVLGDYLKSVKNYFDNIYKNLTVKEHVVSKSDFKKLVDKIRRNGYEKIADDYEKIAAEYQKTRVATKLCEDVALKGKARTPLGRALFNAGYGDDVAKILKYKKDGIYKERFDEFINTLINDGKTIEARECTSLFYKSDLSVRGIEDKELLTRTYSRLAKYVNKNCPKYSRQFDNIFKINDSEYISKNYLKFIEKLKNDNQPELASYVDKFMKDAINSDVIYLGEKDKYLIKEGVDFVKEPFIFAWKAVKFPYYVVNMFLKFFEPAKVPKYESGLKSLSNSVTKLINKVDSDDEVFKKEFGQRLKSSFNYLSKSGVSNAELSNLARFTSKIVTIWFLIADNYNMVMLKSNGDDQKNATLKAKERFIQELSRIFYATMFIDLFNSTFRKAYHASLLGMSAVTAACTVASEYTARASIGMPVGESSQSEILERERANYEDKGAKGKFFRFMSRLTGKKVLTQREQSKK